MPPDREHCVGALLLRGHDVLLGLRSKHSSFPECWDIIGGHVEPGESELEALARELVEEIGVQLVEAKLHSRHSIGTIDLAVFVVRSWSGEPALCNDEHIRIEWHKCDEAATMPNLVAPELSRIIAALGPGMQN